MCLNVISKPEQCGGLAPGRTLSKKKFLNLCKLAMPFHKHDTNGGLLCWSHGASPRVVDTFVNFDQDRPFLNIVFFSGFCYLLDCTVPWPQTSWYEVCTVKISDVFLFHRHLSDVLMCTDFPCLVPEE